MNEPAAGASLDELIETNIGDGTALNFRPGKNQVKNPLDHDRRHFENRLRRIVDNRNRLLNWIRRNLTEGIDYGRVHVYGPKSQTPCLNGNRCTIDWHWSKPSLWKPGAEKILALLGLTPRWPGASDLEHRIIETGRSPQDVMLRCYAVDTHGNVIGEGAGARSVKQDGSLNKAIKMAKKSSMVDCVLTLGGLSEIFSQDIGDDDLTYLTPDATEIAEVCTVGPYTGQLWTQVPNDALRDIQEHPDVADDIKRIAGDVLADRRENGLDDPRPAYPDEQAPTEMTMRDAAQSLMNARTSEALEQNWAAIPERFQTALRSTYERQLEVLRP